jgi:HPt (histidine-containing phosphotransfer) domain-containing protein
MPAGDLQEAMQRFQQEFAQQLPARLQEARQLLDACRASPGNEERLRELHRCVHKLAGSAGTFGMREMSQQARVIEEQLEVLSAQEGRDAEAFDSVGVLLSALN